MFCTLEFVLGNLGLVLKLKVEGLIGALYWRIVGAIERALGRHGSPEQYLVTDGTRVQGGTVDAYWNAHTVNQSPFRSASQSRKYLRWRFKEYPLCREFMDLYSGHDNEAILDYGCGPGDDVVGFLLYSHARQVIGMDISLTALNLLRRRLAVHNFPCDRIQLKLISDKTEEIPLANDSIDYINSGGVLHHTSNPEKILREFHRILKPGKQACVMVYHKDSLWLHLYTAYVRQIVQGQFRNLTAIDAFSKNVDGTECPIARCYSGEEFLELCRHAGFRGAFLGGYLSRHELRMWRRYGRKAVNDTRLGEEHRKFLAQITFDDRRLPIYDGKHAGVGGVYRLVKP